LEKLGQELEGEIVSSMAAMGFSFLAALLILYFFAFGGFFIFFFNLLALVISWAILD
jgi:hypothetical protein